MVDLNEKSEIKQFLEVALNNILKSLNEQIFL